MAETLISQQQNGQTNLPAKLVKLVNNCQSTLTFRVFCFNRILVKNKEVRKIRKEEDLEVVTRNTPPHLKVVIGFKERNLKHLERGRTQIGLGSQTTLKLTQLMHTHTFTSKHTQYNIILYNCAKSN